MTPAGNIQSAFTWKGAFIMLAVAIVSGIIVAVLLSVFQRDEAVIYDTDGKTVLAKFQVRPKFGFPQKVAQVDTNTTNKQ